VWVTDWYNFIQQHNPTPVGFSVGRGAAYETSMRDKLRGRIYRVVYKGAPAAKKRSLSKGDTSGLLEALGSDNMLWRLHAQRLIVERGQKDIVPQLVAMARNRAVDAVGTNGGALHALWTLHGLGELSSSSTPAHAAAVEALKHPAAGVRKAAAMVLPPAAASSQPLLASGLLQDPDLHTRLAAILAVADLPTSPEIGQALYAASQGTENFGDRWLSRALYIAANRHQKTFTSAYRADPNRMPYTGLPVSLRLGTMRPDWRAPADAELSTEWKNMEVPGNWESRGLPDFDGVVWFTRTLDWTETAAPSTLSIGPVRNSGEVWVNGLLLTPTPFAPAAPGGRGPGATAAQPPAARGPASATFAVPPGTLRAGKNTITVRIQNARNDGGFIGTPEAMYVQAGETRTPLAGTWKYRVERQTNAGAFYTRPGQLAAHVAFTAEGGLAGAAGAGLPPVAPQAPDVVLRLSVIPNQLKFDVSELTVAAGQLVEVIFTNPDVMQHNFVLGASGSLTQIGQAADKLATSPAGLTQAYVPDIPQVMFATKLLEPGQSVTFQFKAPATAGQYPYVCTFPSHWQVMNGVLNVMTPAGGRGGRGRL
jgi:azurin